MNWTYQLAYRGALSLTAAMLLLATGCGGGGIGPVNSSVEGVLTLNGQPLANAVVTFVPVVGEGKPQLPSSAGKTDAQGRFKLQYQRPGGGDEAGAVLGKHTVLVSIPVDRKSRSEDPDAKAPVAISNKIPAEYGVVGKSTLSAEVTADVHDYPVKITTR